MLKLKKVVALVLSAATMFAVNVTALAQEATETITADRIISQNGDTTIGVRTPTTGPITRGHIYDHEIYVIKDVGAGYSVEVGALVNMGDGAGGYFNEILDYWSVASGSGSYEWEPSYVYATLLNSDTLELKTSGYIVVAIDSSLSGTVGAELLGANFEVSSTIGQTTYYRKRVSISEKIYAWDEI